MAEQDLKGKTFLVTGANSGIERPTRSVQERLRMYGMSKLMNVLHAAELARRLAGTG